MRETSLGGCLSWCYQEGSRGFFDAAQELTSPMNDAVRWREINDTWNAHVVGPPPSAQLD
jgi:hypothetical protein